MPDGSVLPHAETAMSLLGASPKIAAKKADVIVNALGFPNPYTLSKHLAEDLVAELHTQGRLNACIVRPSIVGANAGGPAPGKRREEREQFFVLFFFFLRSLSHLFRGVISLRSWLFQAPAVLWPIWKARIERATNERRLTCSWKTPPKKNHAGYFGNTAGATSMILAFASGMATFSCHDPDNVFDLVPCDVVAAAVLGAAAGVAAGGSPCGPGTQPLIVHASSSTSYCERYG